MQNPHNRRSNERARTAPGPTRIGYRHADRLINYPHTHSLSISQQPIRIRGRFRRSGRQACTERTGRGAGGRQGQAAVPVGGGGAWPDNEATHRAKLAALTASGRAAAHGHTEQPGPQNSTCSARDTSGATSNTTTGATPTRPGMQKTDPRYRMSACGGARGIRTPDLLIANETRYQLRHSPKDGYTLAPSEVFTQADRHQHAFAP